MKHLNMVVLSGEVCNAPTVANDGRRLQFDLTVGLASAPDGAHSRREVPCEIRFPDRTSSSPGDGPRIGDELLVIGRVDREYFRVGGQTQSRVMVVVEEWRLGLTTPFVEEILTDLESILNDLDEEPNAESKVLKEALRLAPHLPPSSPLARAVRGLHRD